MNMYTLIKASSYKQPLWISFKILMLITLIGFIYFKLQGQDNINFLSDLGIREFSAIYFFDHFGVDLVAVINASLTLWIINILLPTIIGAPLTLKMKLRTT